MWSFIKSAAKGVYNNILKPAVGELLGVTAQAISQPGTMTTQQYLSTLGNMGRQVLGNTVGAVGQDVLGNAMSAIYRQPYQQPQYQRYSMQNAQFPTMLPNQIVNAPSYGYTSTGTTTIQPPLNDQEEQIKGYDGFYNGMIEQAALPRLTQARGVGLNSELLAGDTYNTPRARRPDIQQITENQRRPNGQMAQNYISVPQNQDLNQFTQDF